MGMTETTIGSMNYNVLGSILKKGRILQLNRGAEIGILYADTSSHLLTEFPQLTLHCVDPFLAYDEYEPERTANQMSQYEQIALSRLREFGDRAKMMKMKSLEAAPLIPNHSLDFVFIDALHTYEAVTEDIAAWYDKVRSGGLVAGHDYRWDGVQKAVHEFQSKLGMEGFFTPLASDIWFFVRP